MMESYDDYSLNQLDNWVHDAITSTNNTPKQIYDVIKKAVEEEYVDFKQRSDRAHELLQLLSGDSGWTLEEVLQEREYYEGKPPLSCDKDDPSPECKNSWNDFWGAENEYYPHPDQPVYTEEELNAMCDKASSDQEKEKCREYNLREAEYYDKRAQLDGTYNAMIAKGYTMTDDGFWIHNLRTKKDKVKKWVLPVQEVKESDTGETEYFVSFPDDLLEAANLKEGDQVQWNDNNNGSYTITKVTKPLRMDEC